MSKKPEKLHPTWHELRLDGLDGYSTSQGPTFNGGWFTGGGAKRDRSLTVRTLLAQGRPASVELDLSDADHHGCSVSLPPELARQTAAALVAAADKAEADMAHWRDVVERQRAEMAEAAHREALKRSGLTPQPGTETEAR